MKVLKIQNTLQTVHTSRLVTTTVLNTKTSEVENKITDHAKYITNQEFVELTANILAARSN